MPRSSQRWYCPWRRLSIGDCEWPGILTFLSPPATSTREGRKVTGGGHGQSQMARNRLSPTVSRVPDSSVDSRLRAFVAPMTAAPTGDFLPMSWLAGGRRAVCSNSHVLVSPPRIAPLMETHCATPVILELKAISRHAFGRVECGYPSTCTSKHFRQPRPENGGLQCIPHSKSLCSLRPVNSQMLRFALVRKFKTRPRTNTSRLASEDLSASLC